MNETRGVGVAIVSCCLGAGAAVATRYLIIAADPFTLAAIRFGGGAALPAAAGPAAARALAAARGLASRCRARLRLLRRVLRALQCCARLHDGGTRHARTVDAAADDNGRRPRAGDRAAEPAQDGRRCGGHAGRRRSPWPRGCSDAPPGAWRGDLIMAAATLCMALYNVFSRPFIQRSSALGFLAAGWSSAAGRSCSSALVSAWCIQPCRVRSARLDRGLLSCGRRRGARVLPVGLCAAVRQPHAGRQHHDRQSAGCRAARGSPAE